LREARFIFSIWLLYAIGAASGTWMRSIWNTRALLAPVALIVITIVVDQAAPLSIEEEQDQP
jgi:uncharacterized membrane protein YoaK (UPF0700 family)